MNAKPLLTVMAGLALLVPLAPAAVVGQEAPRIGDDTDPISAAVLISQATLADGAAGHVVIGRHDLFADNLAATALVGADDGLLLAEPGDTPLRGDVAAELRRVLGPRDCGDGDPPDVFLAGGTAAIGTVVEAALVEEGYCVQRLGGATRIETAVMVADAVPQPSATVVLARSDDWADAASIGAWASATRSRVLVTPTEALAGPVADALTRMAPEDIVLVGGTAALSEAVEDAAADIAPVRRVAGAARDQTATAIAEEVWGDDASGSFAVGHGYAGTGWTFLFAGAPLAGSSGRPILLADDNGPTAASQAVLDTTDPESVVLLGPAIPLEAPPVPGPDLDGVAVELLEIGQFDAPMVLRARPGAGELWVAERAGRVRAIGPEGVREVLDISGTVRNDGERGLLGMDFSADGSTLYTSSSNTNGDSVIDAFAIVGDGVDAGSRRQLILVDQPASNHNGGDLHVGPDGYLWWSLGDGGGANDAFGHGQRPDTLLATIVRIDPAGDPYAIPADNPFVNGGGAPEVWAYGLRNPFRVSFDSATNDLWIADVGQGQLEEIDFVPAGSGAGSNFGWPGYEGDQVFRQSVANSIDNHAPPVWTTSHGADNCSITGGVVYRGTAIPDLRGAYLYSDYCFSDIRAIVVEDGAVTQNGNLDVGVVNPVGFGTDHDGEVYVISLRGAIAKIVPA